MRTVFLLLFTSLCAAVSLAQPAAPATLPITLHDCSSPVDRLRHGFGRPPTIRPLLC
jgi:hypothetical protein